MINLAQKSHLYYLVATQSFSSIRLLCDAFEAFIQQNYSSPGHLEVLITLVIRQSRFQSVENKAWRVSMMSRPFKINCNQSMPEDVRL